MPKWQVDGLSMRVDETRGVTVRRGAFTTVTVVIQIPRGPGDTRFVLDYCRKVLEPDLTIDR
jgi:hypothetical protein